MSLQFLRHLKTYTSREISHYLSQVTKDKFTFKYVRSSGPGGQNVNKLNTKVELRINIENSKWIPCEGQQKIHQHCYNLINKDGELILTSEKTRSQYRNVDDALDKFKDILYKALYVPEGPSEETLEKIKERVGRANENRLVAKKFKSVKKRDRKNIE